MDFLEEIIRSATNVADKAREKTTAVTNLAKLNLNLKSTESKLDETYEIIGRLFYTSEREGMDNAASIADYFLEADRLHDEIKTIKADLAKLKNVKICPNCGEEIDINFEYCNHCGTKQEMPVKEEPAEDTTCECCSEEKEEENKENKED